MYLSTFLWRNSTNKIGSIFYSLLWMKCSMWASKSLTNYFSIFISNLFFWDFSIWCSKVAKLWNSFFSAFRSRKIKYCINSCFSARQKNNLNNKRLSIALFSSYCSMVINFFSTGLRHFFSFISVDRCDALLVSNAHRVDFDINFLYCYFYILFNVSNYTYFLDSIYRISCL